MERNSKINWLTAFGLIALSFVLVNCSKSKNSTTAATTGTSYYCSTTGYITYNGAQYYCTAGQTITVGATTTGSSYYCSTTGYVTYNGTQYYCTAGQTISVGTTTTTTGSSSLNCSQYTAMYGVSYVAVYYGGQWVCMRYDIAASYGYY